MAGLFGSPKTLSKVPDTVGYPVIGMSVEVVDPKGKKLKKDNQAKLESQEVE